MAALYLASKTNEETHLKLSDIVNTCFRYGLSATCSLQCINFCRCLHKDKPPLEIGDMYWKLKDSVAMYELVLLRALKFQTEIVLPHKVKPDGSNKQMLLLFLYFSIFFIIFWSYHIGKQISCIHGIKSDNLRGIYCRTYSTQAYASDIHHSC